MYQILVDYSFLHNSLLNWAIFLGYILGTVLLKRIFSIYLSKLVFLFLKNIARNVTITEFVRLISRPIELLILSIGFFVGITSLKFDSLSKLLILNTFSLYHTCHKTFIILIICILVFACLRFIDFLVMVAQRHNQFKNTKFADSILPFIKQLSKIFVIIFAFLFILGFVFNLNVSSIIAGFGLGGLAVALAGKETLENLLGSITIFIDKPFEIGDLVKVGSITGTVEQVGIRSTQIRTLDKSIVSLPNKLMVDQPLENLTQRTLMRGDIEINLTLTSNTEIIKKIQTDLVNLLSSHTELNENTTILFSKISEFSICLKITFFVKTNDGGKFNLIKEEINYLCINLLNDNNLYPERFEKDMINFSHRK